MELRRDDPLRAAADGPRERANRLASVEQEIRRAQAEALGRTGERLQALLDQMATADRRLDALLQDTLTETDRVRAEMDARNRVRDEAVRVRHHLIIQREALGLARQASVEQCYPVPGRRRNSGQPADRGGDA